MPAVFTGVEDDGREVPGDHLAIWLAALGAEANRRGRVHLLTVVRLRHGLDDSVPGAIDATTWWYRYVRFGLQKATPATRWVPKSASSHTPSSGSDRVSRP